MWLGCHGYAWTFNPDIILCPRLRSRVWTVLCAVEGIMDAKQSSRNALRVAMLFITLWLNWNCLPTGGPTWKSPRTRYYNGTHWEAETNNIQELCWSYRRAVRRSLTSNIKENESSIIISIIIVMIMIMHIACQLGRTCKNIVIMWLMCRRWLG